MEKRLINQRYKRRIFVTVFLFLVAGLGVGTSVFFQLDTYRSNWSHYSHDLVQRAELIQHLYKITQYQKSAEYNGASDVLFDDSIRSALISDFSQARSFIDTYLLGQYSEEASRQIIELQYQLDSQLGLLVRSDVPIIPPRSLFISASRLIKTLSNENFTVIANAQSALDQQINTVKNLLLIGFLVFPWVVWMGYRQLGLSARLVEYFIDSRIIEQRLKEATTEHGVESAQKAKYRELAYRCPLTKILNRQGFYEQTEEVFRCVDKGLERVVVLFIDVDDFKDINDTYGHSVGDGVLVELAQRLQSCLRDGDYVARIGGDEFVIMLAGQESSEAAAMVELRLTNALAQPFRGVEGEIHVSCSVGGAIGPEDGATLDALLRQADKRMYLVKNNGKGSVLIGNQTIKTTLQSP